MRPRPLCERVLAVGAADWDRRLFDGLIPLPDGTSYNSYLVRGSEKTALIDTVDPSKTDRLLSLLRGAPVIDYIVAHHGEQDHSGSIPAVLALHPAAKVVCSPKAKGILADLLPIAEDRFLTVEDGARLSLGDRTLEFAHTPWVHWPETMCTYLVEEKTLFSCDFFGSHLAQSGLFADDEGRVHEAAKRYFAEIMMPFRGAILKNLERLKGYDIGLIAPSHGPAHDRPRVILDAYRDWASDRPKNAAVVASISMHGSTERLLGEFVAALAEKGLTVDWFNLAEADLGRLAVSLVDAATVVLAGPAVLGGLHPKVAEAAFLANALRPKARFAGYIGSYGWGHKMLDQLTGLIPNLKIELLPPLLFRGRPRPADLEAAEQLAASFAAKHSEAGLAL